MPSAFLFAIAVRKGTPLGRDSTTCAVRTKNYAFSCRQLRNDGEETNLPFFLFNKNIPHFFNACEHYEYGRKDQTAKGEFRNSLHMHKTIRNVKNTIIGSAN